MTRNRLEPKWATGLRSAKCSTCEAGHTDLSIRGQCEDSFGTIVISNGLTIPIGGMFGIVADVPGAERAAADHESSVCTEKSDPDVLAVQSTEDRVRYDASDALNGA